MTDYIRTSFESVGDKVWLSMAYRSSTIDILFDEPEDAYILMSNIGTALIGAVARLQENQLDTPNEE